MKDYYFSVESNKTQAQQTDSIVVNQNIGSNATDFDNPVKPYIEHDTQVRGSSQAHENRPPYYVLAYIMRLS